MFDETVSTITTFLEIYDRFYLIEVLELVVADSEPVDESSYEAVLFKPALFQVVVAEWRGEDRVSLRVADEVACRDLYQVGPPRGPVVPNAADDLQVAVEQVFDVAWPVVTEDDGCPKAEALIPG